MNSIIKPFRGLRPKSVYIHETIAPPYDVITRDRARVFAKDKPHNFLHLSKPEIDVADNISLTSAIACQQVKDNFKRFMSDNIFQCDDTPSLYLYQINTPDHTQKGLVSCVSLEDRYQGRLRRHELTRPDKVDGRVQLLKWQVQSLQR